MANTRELRRRIKSVKNTSQITKAMQMVAATKMRRAQNQALAGRPYSETLDQSLARMVAKVNPEKHPLLQENDAEKIGVLVLSTDKALCGALNTNTFRLVQSFTFERSSRHSERFERGISFYSVGKKGTTFLARTGKNLEADFENPEVVTFRQARQIAKLLTEAYLNSELKEVYVVYPNFVTTLKQEPTIEKLLPFNAVILSTEKDIYSSSSTQNDKSKHRESSLKTDILFEPSIDDLLDFILTHQIETKIYQALLETKASEHSARMMAMQNATDNALELVDDLTLSYNQTRQAAITNELLEITTAQAAME